LNITYVSTLFTRCDKSISVAPDLSDGSLGAPTADFVLCRDKTGNPTAIYGQNRWDFNPYRLSAKKISALNFDTIFEGEGAEEQALIGEIKYIFFCLIYYIGTGRVGRLSPATLAHYWFILRHAAVFCLGQKANPLTGALSLQQLLTNPAYLVAFARGNSNNVVNDYLPRLLNNLVAVGEGRLGYKVLSGSDFRFREREQKQHPVIPTRIYIEIINKAADFIDQLYPGVDRLASFIANFEDGHYGRSHSSQELSGVDKLDLRPDFGQALQDHGLSDVFSGEFACSCRRSLGSALTGMQFLLKNVIHLYTGMRDQEVMRLRHDCLGEETAVPETVDDIGSIRDPARMVSILSTTTKFEGYKKQDSWLATAEVIKAVHLAQAICSGLVTLFKVDDARDCPLFISSSIILNKKSEMSVRRYDGSSCRKLWLSSMLIQSVDLAELLQSDPARDFYSEAKFAIGQPWPLSSHQFRRSLAFYASSSGFVSLPSLRSQFKHMTIQMTRYYTNGFENLKTIFGYYDADKNDFVLPKSHVALEFQMGIPMAVANQLLADVLGKDMPLFGGTGSFMEKQKARVAANEVNIENVRAETIVRAKNGDISYRPTLLGGCTKVGRCDSFLLGDFTECLSCEGAIIKPDKIDEAIAFTTDEISGYEIGTGEYQVARSELDRLVNFKRRLIDVVRV